MFLHSGMTIAVYYIIEAVTSVLAIIGLGTVIKWIINAKSKK